ncbi:MAG: hypothetical protein V7640_2026, partial [Betaproteobacteria bacterium]
MSAPGPQGSLRGCPNWRRIPNSIRNTIALAFATQVLNPAPGDALAASAVAAEVSAASGSNQSAQAAAIQERPARPAAAALAAQWSNRPYSIVEPVELQVAPAAQPFPTSKLIEPKMLPQFADDLRATRTAPVVNANDQLSARAAGSNAAITDTSVQATASRNAVGGAPATVPSSVVSPAPETLKTAGQPTRATATNNSLVRADAPAALAAAPVAVA